MSDVAWIVVLLTISVLVVLHGAKPSVALRQVELPAPAGTQLEALRAPPTSLQLLSAQIAALDAIGASIEGAIAACPEVPWGKFGLADVEIKRTSIRLDPSRGRYVADLEDGRMAILTLDPRIQQRLLTAMKRATEPGEATVAIDPSTGRVLALADDGEDEVGIGLTRRAYAWSASIFKVITAAALFENSQVRPTTQTCFHGGGDGFTEELLRDNAEQDTLCISFQRAMALSANVVFGRHADRNLTPEKLTATGERFAFNAQIPFEMPVESSLLQVPSGRLEFAQAAAGFRHSRMSPLHGALIQAAIANDGVMMVPTLVEQIVDRDGAIVWEHTPVIWRESVTPAQAALLREVQATTCVNGTARADFSARPGWPAAIQVWGKTGTLLNRRLDGSLPSNPLTYRWFTGIARRGEREIAVSSLVVQNPSWQIRGAYLASEAVLSGLPPTP